MMSQCNGNSHVTEQHVPEKCSTPQMETQYSDDEPNQQPHHSASSPNMSNSDVTYQVTPDQSHSVKVSRSDTKLPVRQIPPDGDLYKKISKTRSEPALNSVSALKWDYGIIGHDNDKDIQARWKRILEKNFRVLTFNEFPLTGVTHAKKRLQFRESCSCVLWIATEKSKSECGYLKYFKDAALHNDVIEGRSTLLICIPSESRNRSDIVIPVEYKMYDFIEEDEHLITKLKSHLCGVKVRNLDSLSQSSTNPLENNFECLEMQSSLQRTFNHVGSSISKSHDVQHSVTDEQQTFRGTTEEDGQGAETSACAVFAAEDDSYTGDGQEIEDNGHIMISYNHRDSFDLATKINEALIEAGYRTWIDQEEMRGDMLDKMPEAVKNSFVVLVFLSPGYYESPYCEKEAKYANTLKVPIIPIKNSDYRPEPGTWLDFITSSLTYYNFENEVFEVKFKKLLKDIEEKKEQAKQEKPS